MYTLPVYEASDPKISAISLVDCPAINTPFKVQPPTPGNSSFYITGPALVPDLEMLRVLYSSEGVDRFFIMFNEESVINAAFAFTFGSEDLASAPIVDASYGSVEDSSVHVVSDHQFTLNHDPKLSAKYHDLLSQVVLTNSWISAPDWCPEHDLGFSCPFNTWFVTLQCPIQLLPVINEYNLKGLSLELSALVQDTSLQVVI